MESPTVWIDADIARELNIDGTGYPCQIMEIKKLVYEVLKDGRTHDIVVLPYFRGHAEIVRHIRERSIQGPVIIYSRGESMLMNLSDLASQGVLFLDSEHFPQPMLHGFITFLQKTQDVIANVPDGPVCKSPATLACPTDNAEKIREIFRQIMGRHARILITCQFRDDLPTLCVTCQVIQMAGEVETKLVLDKFNPAEFVGFYKQLTNGKPLNAYISMDEETLGFELRVVHVVMGKITVLLPGAVFAQKRKFFRVEPDVKNPVILHLQQENSPTKGYSVHDVSEGGCGFTTLNASLEKGVSYAAALVLPMAKTILGQAQICIKEQLKADLFFYGTALTLHESDLLHLRQYIYKRQAGILASIRDLSL